MKKTRKPQVLVLSGYGLNCEEETAFAFDSVGGDAHIIHINDLVQSPALLKKAQIVAVPGGFSFGDHMGSGKAYAQILRTNLGSELREFVDGGGLVIGICNGFQILTALGLLPGVLLHNTGARYLTRWVDIKFSGSGPWTKGLKTLSLPIAHGEGRYTIDAKGMRQLKKEKAIAGTYVRGEMCKQFGLNANPNGAMQDIAGVTACNGRVLGLMPHPERALFFTQLPDWTLRKELHLRKKKKIPTEGPGTALFRNAVNFCKKRL